MSGESAQKFQEALAKRNQRKAEDEARKNNPSGGGFTEVPFSALITGSQRVFRMLGYPYDCRVTGTDCKKIWTSIALNDSDGFTRLFGPDPRSDEGKAWILYRFMNTVLSYDWDPEMDGGKGGKRYHYQESNPDLFNRVRKNNQLQNKYATGWQFDAVVLFNCIDRSAMDWHKEHKKARVLSKGTWESKSKPGEINFELGVPDTVYTSLMDDVVALDGNTDWTKYDVIIERLTAKPWYKVYHPIDDKKRITEASAALASVSPLTDEEKSWELWNFDKIYKISRYKRLFDSFGLTFQKVDKVFGKTFYEELKDLVAQEEKEISEQKAKEAKDAPPAATGTPAQRNEEPTSRNEEPAPQESSPAEEAPARSREPAPEPREESGIPWDKLADGSFNGTTYVGVPEMTDQEKAWVTAVKADGSFEYDPAAGVLYQSSKSKFFSPEKFHVDPLDGRIFPPPSAN